MSSPQAVQLSSVLCATGEVGSDAGTEDGGGCHNGNAIHHRTIRRHFEEGAEGAHGNVDHDVHNRDVRKRISDLAREGHRGTPPLSILSPAHEVAPEGISML